MEQLEQVYAFRIPATRPMGVDASDSSETRKWRLRGYEF